MLTSFIEIPFQGLAEHCHLKTANSRALRASYRLWSAGKRTKADLPFREGVFGFRWFSVQLPWGI